MAIWLTVPGATWADVRVGDRISLSTPGVDDLQIIGRVSRLTEDAAEFKDGMIIVPKADYAVTVVVRQS
ncbi:hypothetical protein [Promicromonospora sp. NPDC023805]|uniref:hypothetical protein n=1 Tax=Promicromonospora sp. NPDC023805 TaxID=3154696 RepID=UPI0033D3CD97